MKDEPDNPTEQPKHTLDLADRIVRRRFKNWDYEPAWLIIICRFQIPFILSMLVLAAPAYISLAFGYTRNILIMSAVMLVILQLALLIIVVIVPFYKVKYGMLGSERMGQIVCAHCGHPYAIGEAPLRCPACDTDLDQPNTLLDYRPTKPEHKSTLGRENADWRLRLQFVFTVALFGWIITTSFGWYFLGSVAEIVEKHEERARLMMSAP